MAVTFQEKARTFTLHTDHSTYQMKVDHRNALFHTYYGEKVDESDLSYLQSRTDSGFSGNPYDVCHISDLREADRGYSLDCFAQEYSCFGSSDFRITGLRVRHADGSKTTTLFYDGYEICDGKYELEGLPSAYAAEEEVQTLKLRMKDPVSGLCVTLLYGIFEKEDMITRAVLIENRGTEPLYLEKAASMSLDFMGGDFDLVTFYGKHVLERQFQRAAVGHGVQSVGSIRGASSHHYNPFAILCGKDATEEFGDCYGISFVYSGDFLIETEKDQQNHTRMICGLHPDDFCWKLMPGETFTTPEVMMCYSREGFGGITRSYHEMIQEHIVRGVWKKKRRPILINNWEGTYFDFNGEKLVSIAREAAALGIEMFVMDDGWFGKREDDNTGLGDWVPNEKKLGCTLKELGDQIEALGMKFGIWFEPECISEDSDLYRAHPDWAICVPGRLPDLSRNQLILDFSREEVQDAIYEQMEKVLRGAPISYVKWDFNRHICNKYSRALPADRQGEMAHRYVLGLYRVLERLHAEFPEILFEGCCGGGGRFDAGMLAYTPQIWCSDDTDPIERLKIHYGTSFAYPVSTMGAHVSAVPNHQTGRTTPLSTRGCVAMAGTFGYELDVNRMTDSEKEEVKNQIAIFKEQYDLIQYGTYFRLTSPFESRCVIWEMAAKDGSGALVSAVFQDAQGNQAPIYTRLKGLKEDARYRIELTSLSGEKTWKNGGFPEGDAAVQSGKVLMRAGLMIPFAEHEYQAWQIRLTRVDE